jgi:hypothetical protein
MKVIRRVLMPLITLLFEQIYLTQNDEMLVDLNS